MLCVLASNFHCSMSKTFDLLTATSVDLSTRMDHKSSKAKVQSTIFPNVTDRKFVFIFICALERVLNITVSSDISRFITMYADLRNRIIWIDDSMPKSASISIMDGVNMTKKTFGHGIVLCGDGKLLDGNEGPKFEVVFRINKMGYVFSIGYIFGSNPAVNFEVGLGVGSNSKSSVGIRIWKNEFYLDDRDNFEEKLQCQTKNSILPEQGQIWRVSWDMSRKEMEISVMNQQEMDWIPMIRYAMDVKHCHVIPAFSLPRLGDSIVRCQMSTGVGFTNI